MCIIAIAKVLSLWNVFYKDDAIPSNAAKMLNV